MEQQRDESIADIEDEESLERDLNCTVQYYSNDLISIKTNVYEFRYPSAHPSGYCDSRNFWLTNGNYTVVELSSLFKPHLKWRDRLIHLLKQNDAYK